MHCQFSRFVEVSLVDAKTYRIPMFFAIFSRDISSRGDEIVGEISKKPITQTDTFASLFTLLHNFVRLFQRWTLHPALVHLSRVSSSTRQFNEAAGDNSTIRSVNFLTFVRGSWMLNVLSIACLFFIVILSQYHHLTTHLIHFCPFLYVNISWGKVWA